MRSTFACCSLCKQQTWSLNFLKSAFGGVKHEQQFSKYRIYCSAGSEDASSLSPRPGIQHIGQAKPVLSSRVKKKPEVQYMKVELPPATHTRVKQAKYISSSVRLPDCPPESHPEFAVVGRSNVGKSSLINMLTETSGLAKVSKEPGMTKCINHFLINGSWYLVDLPGYGYAKSSKDKRLEWLDFTKEYFINRGTLANVLVLVDASIPPLDIDIECTRWLGGSEVPFSIVFTKIDKSKDSEANMMGFKRQLQREWEAIPPCFETSSKTGLGKAQLLQYLGGLRELFLTQAAE